MSNYPDHELYFSQEVASESTFNVGKSKRKLAEIKVKLHKEYVEREEACIDGETYNTERVLIAFEISGKIQIKDVVEGGNVIQAYSMLIGYLIQIFEEHQKDNGIYFYENDYDDGWNRRTLEEVFWYIVRSPD